MRFSYISALLLAPIALASPIASPDSISVAQRDASASIEARYPALSVRIMKVVEESEKITDLCKKFSGKMVESFAIYKQFKKCHKAVEYADRDAKESGPFGESESAKIEESLGKLTVVFVQISKSILQRKEMIRNSRYKNTIVGEFDSLRVFVRSFHQTCEKKATTPHQKKIKEYGDAVDARFETVKNSILDDHKDGYKAQRSLESRDEEMVKEAKEHFSFPGFPDMSSFAELPGFSNAEKKAFESRSDEGKEIKGRFSFPKLPDFSSFGKKLLAKRNLDFFKHLPDLCKDFLGSASEHGDSEGMILPMKTKLPHAQAMQMMKGLMHMLSSQSCLPLPSGCKFGQMGSGNGLCEPESGSCQNKDMMQGLLKSLMGNLVSVGDAKKSIGSYQPGKAFGDANRHGGGTYQS
ncbi:hypothetical protein DSL72_007622 [Monilinia vaccinii-corymbosi]|uniref:Fungal N-terminal domain-containing protein n=1 Tax=Monilinia vaccinii-corymbosi TaxID=61207 RepID=A0A8A3PIC1_9HELO|nr:hypothetical protein DSL72_007622 [Monilinia vaccinii-corymbosi]